MRNEAGLSRLEFDEFLSTSTRPESASRILIVEEDTGDFETALDELFNDAARRFPWGVETDFDVFMLKAEEFYTEGWPFAAPISIDSVKPARVDEVWDGIRDIFGDGDNGIEVEAAVPAGPV